jgi:hypothetical protein
MRKINSLYKLLVNSGLKKEAEEVLELQGGPTKLYIFDFDGTLFRSPSEPALWKGGWWGKEASLSPPCVPQTPEGDWWVSEVVSQARAAISDSSALSVLMTGRSADVFSSRVNELLSGAGLNFSQVLLSNSYDTVSFKSGEILRILKETPSIKSVVIFDDRKSYLAKYSSLISEFNSEIKVETSLIRAASKGALCDESPPEDFEAPTKSPFVGIFLTSESKGKLFERFPAEHDNIYGEHVTVIFKPTREQLKDMKDLKLLGKKFDINVTGYAKNKMGQAVKVDVPGAVFSEGRIPHITISTAEGIKPVYSTELLQTEEVEPVSDLTLSGIMWWKQTR